MRWMSEVVVVVVEKLKYCTTVYVMRRRRRRPTSSMLDNGAGFEKLYSSARKAKGAAFISHSPSLFRSHSRPWEYM